MLARESSNPKNILAARLRSAFVEIMYGCNMGCKYCYVGWNSNHLQQLQPDLSTTCRILDELKEAEVEEIILLGGEPLLHPKFPEICSYAAKLGFLHRGVVSNGSHFSDELITVIKSNGFWVDITFRGAAAETFDTLARFSGAFNKAVEAVERLARFGISVGIEFDCTPQNYRELFGLAVQLKDRGVHPKQIQLHRILPAGDAAVNPATWTLSRDQWTQVLSQASEIRSQLGITVVFEDGFPYCLVDQKYWELLLPCACGYSLITIDPIGEARYCSCHGSSLGNILQTPLNEIWQERLSTYRSIDRYPEPCRQCDLLEICRGGCSASGWADHAGREMFEEELRPIKLQGEPLRTANRIIAQEVVSD